VRFPAGMKQDPEATDYESSHSIREKIDGPSIVLEDKRGATFYGPPTSLDAWPLIASVFGQTSALPDATCMSQDLRQVQR
jgi:hypothetical protein